MQISEGKRRWLTLLAVGLGALLFGCCGGIGSIAVCDRLMPSGTRGVGIADVIGPRRVTAAHYDAIKTDMQYGEVVRIIGFPGTEYTRNLLRDSGRRTQGFIWANPDGSNITCELDNEAGTMLSKAQFGLK